MNAHTNITAFDEQTRAELEQEIGEIDAQLSFETSKRHAGARWFNQLSIEKKLKLAVGFPIIGLLLVTLALFIGAINPEFASFARWPALAICIYTLVNGLLFARRMMVDSIKPIGEIADNMKRLAAGDYDFTISHAERSDEVGDLARSTEVFAKASVKFFELLEARRESERKRKEGVLQLSGAFENSIGRVAGGVATASSQLRSTAGEMAQTAEKSSEQSAVVAQAMDEASSGFTAAAAASDEFAISISEISRQAAQSAELARKASDTTGEADETISALSASADQVGAIVELIQSIAQRTNLLALNASIEAARGGEAGRGFAVVASEVKELAAQTSRATQDVADQIANIQQSTGNSVTALRSIGEQVKQLETTAISIASAVDQQSVASQDLARSIDRAALSTDEVRANIIAVRDTALTTGSAASQLLNSATELEGQAGELRAESDNFLSQLRSSMGRSVEENG